MSTKSIIRIFVAVGLVCALLYVGLIRLRMAIVNELTESGLALLELNQGYTIAGLTGASRSSLGLSKPTDETLARAGFGSVNDVAAHTESELRSIPGIDDDAIREIRDSLLKTGRTLNASDPNRPIAVLNLSGESSKALATRGITTVGGLTSKTEAELAQLPLDAKTLNEVKTQLAVHGQALMPAAAGEAVIAP